MRKIKKRKKGLTVMLLILVFSISIGYASLSTQLNMSGTVTIRYESSDVTVTFNANGGTVNTNSKSVTKESQYGELPTPTKEGYTFLGWSKNQIPQGYQQVEYIEKSTKYRDFGEYIDTGIVTNSSNYNKIRLIVDEQITESNTDGWYLTGASDENAINVGIHGEEFYATIGDDNMTTEVSHNGINKRYLYDLDASNNTIKIEDVETDTILVNQTISPINTFTNEGLPLYLMAYSGENRGHACKLYGAKIYMDGELIKNFLPCIRQSDNAVGLYETVEGEFYENSGNGEITSNGANYANYVTSSSIVDEQKNHTLYACWNKNVKLSFNSMGGSNIQDATAITGNAYGTLPIPQRNGYTFKGWSTTESVDDTNGLASVEYLTKDTLYPDLGEYIKTGVIINSSNYDKVRFTIDMEIKENGNGWYLIGIADKDDTNVGIHDNKFYYGTGVSADTNTGVTVPNAGGRYIYDLNVKDGTIVIKDYETNNNIVNQTLQTNSNTTTTAGHEMYLFGWERGIDVSDSKGVSSNIYSSKIYMDGVLIRDYIPCIRASDKTLGMFDRIENIFYTNVGSGSFKTKKDPIVGEETIVTTNLNHTLYAVWEKQEENNNTPVLHLNGTNNTLSGHNSTSKIWYDVSGVSGKNAVIQTTNEFRKVIGNTIWEEDSLRLDGNTYYNLSTPRNDFYGTVEVEVEIDSDFTPQNSNNWYECSTIFGCELSGTQKDWAIIIDKSGYFAFGYSTNTIYSSSVKANDGNRHTVSYTILTSQLIFKVDGEVIGTVNYTNSGTAISTYGLGWNNSSGNSKIKGNIYDLKFYTTEDELIVHFNGVNNTLNGHSSNTEDWANLAEPDMFTGDALRLNKENSQIITVDSPVDDSFGTVEIEVEIDSDFVPINSNYWYECSTIFGCELYGTQKDWAIIIDKNGNFAFGYSTGSIYSSIVKANDGNKHTVSYSYTPTKLTFEVDGEVIGAITYNPAGNPITTFGIGWNNSSTNTNISGKIYSIKFYDDE